VYCKVHTAEELIPGKVFKNQLVCKLCVRNMRFSPHAAPFPKGAAFVEMQTMQARESLKLAANVLAGKIVDVINGSEKE